MIHAHVHVFTTEVIHLAQISPGLVYPRKSKSVEYKGITLSVCLSVCLLSVCRSACTIMLSPYLFIKDCLLYEGVSGFWPKMIKATLMLVEGKFHNSCPVHLFLLKIHWMSLLHKKIPYDLRMSWFWPKDIWAGSRWLEEKVHSSYLVIFLFWETLKFPISHKNAYDIECFMILTQRHLDRFKVNGR